MNKPEPPVIPEDELIRLLMAPQTGGMTTTELSDATGLGRATVVKRLRELAAQGRLEVLRKRAQRLDGVVGTVPSYKLRD